LQEEFLLLKLKDKREPMAKTEALAEDLGQSRQDFQLDLMKQ